VPAASPPLGLTARALIALAAALVGALVGLAIARRVARAQIGDSPSDSTTFANGARRPLDVTAELGDDGLASGFGQPVTRRRALTIDEYDQPGEATVLLPDAEGPESDPAYAEPADAPEAADEPFEPYSPYEDPAEAWASPEPIGPAHDAPTSVSLDVEPLPPEPEAASRQAFEPAPEREPEPLAFAPPSLARQDVEEPDFVPEPEPTEPRQVAPAPASAPSPATDGPEMVQLVNRLKTSLERRREGLASAPPAEPPAAPAIGFEPAPADDAAQAMAAYFTRPTHAAPPLAAGADTDADEDEDEDAEPEEEAEEADSGYSSLLAMRSPYVPRDNARAPIEIPEADIETPEADEGPVETEVPEDTDAALRAALAKLQRMSGAG
jgi:hypothetical protein